MSRDEKDKRKHKLAIFIYNLEPSYMSGSHWVATYVKNKVINCFDSFGMPPFQEMADHTKKKTSGWYINQINYKISIQQHVVTFVCTF